jgi:UDP-3-O-[3-hydroxymyristoyl] glucosamine N-acyltransferase
MATKTLIEIAELINAELQGNPDCKIIGAATLQDAREGQLGFLDNPKYRRFLATTEASAVILTESDIEYFSGNALIVDNPHYAFAQAASLFAHEPKVATGIHPAAIIGENCQIDPTAAIAANVVIGNDVTIGANSQIGAGCIIEENCKIGNNCRLWPNVTLYYGVELHNYVSIHSGAVIGADGFGWAQHEGKWHKVPQLGKVIIEDKVDIGVNTTIDRGTLNDTVIETGVKLDNQIQIAHNVRVGAHTIIAGCTGIAGSTKIGKYCMIGGAVIITGHIEITDYVIITGGTAIGSSIKEPGMYSSGVPPMKNQEWRRNAARFRHLDKLAKRVKTIEKKLQEFTEK